MDGLLSSFSKPIQRIILEKGFTDFTEPQKRAIPLILGGKNVLIIAPTGTGKTEAAFLPILDTIIREGGRGGIKALYISPLRALNRDLLDRLIWWCGRLDLKVAVRHGDTETKERGKQALAPPDIMITTPETLQAILPGRRLRDHLSHVRWVIVDEVHELTNDKRGSQLTVALERLRAATKRDPQIIGLSATIGSPEEVAKFLVGGSRECEIVKVSVVKNTRLEVEFPEADEKDMELAEKIATFPEVAARLRKIRELVEGHRSTLIFTNTRSEAEILASRFRMWDINIPVSIHHGSLAKSSRVEVENALKKGELKGVVCTSSLELGIDIGNIDLVIQYNSPRQATRLLQRVGRAGHWVGGTSKGIIITMDSDDALESTAIVKRSMREELEDVAIVKKPYDVLAHQVAGLLLEDGRRTVDEILEIVREAYPFKELTEGELVEVLEYMSNRRPRLALYLPDERLVLKIKPTEALYKYYFENLSMIPEERHYIVIDEAKDEAVGMLDEAFIAEYGDPGVKFIERGMPWKIIQIFKDTVYVRGEKDAVGAIPDWIGDEIPVPYEIAMEVGRIRRLVEEGVRGEGDYDRILGEISSEFGVSREVLKRALREAHEQAEGKWHMPTDTTITVEGWQGYIIVSCAFGLMVNKTLARVLGYLLAQQTGSGAGISQDSYRIFINASVDPAIVADLLKAIDLEKIGAITEAAVVKTGLFRRRLIHVAKRMGVIEKDADLGDVGISNLLESLVGTVIYKEAMREVLYKDLDVEGLKRALIGIKQGAFQIRVISNDLALSPISRIGINELSWKTDLVPADRLRRLLVESGKARLLNEARVAVCASCFGYVENLKIKRFLAGVSCPECGSKKIGLLDDDPAEVEQMASEKAETGKASEKYRGIYRSAVETGDIIELSGVQAALALAARGIPKPVVFTLATAKFKDIDQMVDVILKEEKAALKSRYRRHQS
uniref:DEAD/DEAH box helicase n=1 Tax=Candidatus Methanomethylicus mesodigestus TaxID=1867258 RepID=A0A7C3J4Y7_9CREN